MRFFKRKSARIEGSDNRQENGHSIRSFPYKVFKTLMLVLVWVCIGLWSEINGPSLPDLMYRTNSDYEIISQAVSMRGAGGLIGCFFGGPIVDAFINRSELIIGLSLVICATMTAIIPFSPHVEVLYFAFMVEGLFEALINIAGQFLIMQTWLSKANAPLHLLHLGYGAGGFLVPQIIKSFISATLPANEDKINPKCLNQTNMTDSGFNSTNSSTAMNETARSQPSETLQYGFLIVASIIVVVSIVFFVDAWLVRHRVGGAVGQNQTGQGSVKKTIKGIFNLNTCSPGQPYFAFNLLLYMFLWTFLAVIGERVFAKYLYSFARSENCFTKDEAVNIQTAFWLSFTAGRFSGFLVTNFVPMPVVIIVEGSVLLTASIVLYFFNDVTTVLYVCVCVMGIFNGPCYPSGLAWTNHYIMVTGVGLSILSIGGGVSDITFLFTIGYYIEKLTLSVVPAFILGYGVLVCILPIIMQATACPKGDRFQRERENDFDGKELE